ncbi:ribonuclease H-like domain-containing protein [Candidatus Acetothermia bacterium]|nr:ribonuclease H-like domain-containing protein [Candidatus Acetothermia bacterium]MBI3642947.1 ribonuclease H-like domain-containing protein [Candidatus Acetothermia bacterium]
MAVSLDRIARRLRERVESTVESGLFTSENQQPFGLSHLSPTDFARSMKLKGELLLEFKDRALAEYYDTEERENEYGACLKITHHAELGIELCTAATCIEEFSRELKLLYGIGPSVESKLRTLGYETLSDLLEHPRWGSSAKEMIQCLDESNAKALQSHIHRWFPISHPLSCKLISLVDPAQIKFFDLESLGLFGRPILLFGTAQITESGLEVVQYLVRNIMEELPALIEIAKVLGVEPALVTYNGRAFDTNLLEERWGYYGLNVEFDPVHFDLLHPARRCFRDKLPDAKLSTVESYYGLTRQIDLPGSLVPDFYNTYLETQNIGPLIPIIEHNKQDLITLAVLLTEFSR